MYIHSKWTPPHWTIPPVALEEQLSRFSKEMGNLFKTRKGKTNLLQHQRRALSTLQQQDTFLIVPCNKNLGPAIIECHDYLKIAMRDHLNDTTTYKLLNPSEIECTAIIVKKYCCWAHGDGTNIHLGKTRLKQSPICSVILDPKSTQVETRRDGGSLEEQTHRLMPRKSTSWFGNMG